MTMKVTFNGASFSKPGVYPAVKVLNLTGFPLQPTGIVAIIGEAIGGQPGVLDVLEGPQIQAAKARYKSGAIADALGLLAAPSKDPRIPNGASKVIVYKTNTGTQAARNLNNNAGSPVAMLGLLSRNWGGDENNISAKVTAGSVLDANAAMTGSVNGPWTFGGSETLILKIFGVTYTYTTTLSAGSHAAAALVTDLNTAANWSGSVKPVIAAVSGTGVKITLDPTVVAALLDYGYLYVDPASTLDTLVGLVGSSRGVRGTRFVIFQKGTLTEGTLPEVGGQAVLSLKYVGAGTAAVMSIQDTGGQRVLTTICTGASGDNLSIVLGAVDTDNVMQAKLTIQDLVNLIGANAAYTCTTAFQHPTIGATDLDYYSAVNIEQVTLDLKRDAQAFVDACALSTLVAATKVSNVSGTVALVTTAVFLAGATDGTSANSNFSTGFDGLKQIRAELVVPLLSTDIGSLSVDTVNALADAHANVMWSAMGRSPRQVVASRLGSKAVVKAAAQALNSGYTSLLAQDVKVFSFSQDKLAFLDPWAAACLAAGMQAGAEVGEPITFKVVNCNDQRVRDGSWNPKLDFTEMIDAGIVMIEPMDTAGFRFVVGNTTYGTDASFVYNRSSVVEAAGYVYYDLMVNLEALYTGVKARTGSAQNIAGTVSSRMDDYRDIAEVIVGDDNNKGKGFKDLRVSLTGNKVAIDVTITPVQGIDFILPTIYLADIKQSA